MEVDKYRMTQGDFDLMIGRLDRILSEMVQVGKSHIITEAPLDDDDNYVFYINRQTLKHHAEDMILAGQKILKDLGFNQPEANPGGIANPRHFTLDTRHTTDHYIKCSRCGSRFLDMTTHTDAPGSHKYMRSCECKGIPSKLIIFSEVDHG